MKIDLSKARWVARLLVVAIGGIVAATGLADIHMGYWWVARENTLPGTPGLAPTLAFVFWGFIIIVLGLIPWPKSREPRKHR
jgi:hypothetical protein